MTAQAVADDLDITRNAVYQHITSLKKNGALPDTRQREDVAGDPLALAAQAVEHAERRIEQIDAEMSRLKEEREQLTQYVKRNRDLVLA